MLGNGFHDVPRGKVAAVVTHLEMRAAAEPRGDLVSEEFSLQHVQSPETSWYRDLFLRVGGQDWLWFSRLGLDDAALAEILNDPLVDVYALIKNGQAEGFLELDFRQAGECELAFFGVTPKLIGTGAGRFLMNNAIRLAWSRDIRRFHVHTCTLDSPAALPFYLRSGFTALRQQIEIAPDNRISGANGFNRDHAQHVPIFD